MKRHSWLPNMTLFGGLLAATLLLVPQHGKLVFVAWLACVLGIVAARFVGGFLPQPEQVLQRSLLETLVRPAFPLAACVAVAVSVPVHQSQVFATALVVFFLVMLSFDRFTFVSSLARANLSQSKTLAS